MDRAQERRRGTTQRPRSELREILLAAGRDLVLEEGFGNGVEHITFKKVFDAVEDRHGFRCTNASVIGRIWGNQAEFQAEVLSSMPFELDHDRLAETFSAVAAIVDAADPSKLETREQAMYEAIRVSTTAHAKLVLESRTWPIWMGIWAVTASGTTEEVEPTKARLREILQDTYESESGAYALIFEWVLDRLGFKVAQPYDLGMVATAMTSLVEGLAMQELVGIDGLHGIERATGPGGSAQRWSLLGVACEAVARQMVEPDPGFSPG